MPNKPGRGRLGRYAQLSRSDRRLTHEALLTLIAFRTAVGTTSWPRLSRRLGEPQQGDPSWDWHGDWGTVLPVLRAVERCRRVIPLISTCLVAALTGQRMLAKRGVASALVLGLRQGDRDGSITAHGWLRVGDHVVLGRGEMRDYIPVASYLMTVDD
jgi:hypothetical protein